MKLLRYIAMVACTALWACTGPIRPSSVSDTDPDIYPDYWSVTVPCNIAPLNFFCSNAGDDCALIIKSCDTELQVKADDGDFDIPIDCWHKLLDHAKGDTLTFTVCRRDGEQWQAMRPFWVAVSPDSIDNTLVYRLIPPTYEMWNEMGIYQRDLEGFDQTAIYENRLNNRNCANCHSLCMQSPDRFHLHMRADGGATYIQRDGQKWRLDTKTDSTISSFTYPYWHPSGRFIAYSVNDISQIFHTTDANRTEVIDLQSDVIVYDIDRGEAFSSPLLKSASAFETFPAFSSDGRTLYYCSAPARPNALADYKDIRYSLCAIGFDPQSGTFAQHADTLFHATDSLGIAMPRPSPDGRWLVATVSPYGNFKIWHHDADLWLLDLATGQWQPMDAANSQRAESYHSWSANSRWLAFSSRRDDGLYTRPYFIHIADDGTPAKPFMLPQRHPRDYYRDLQFSYNIPELSHGPVTLSPSDMVDWISCPTQKPRWRKNY